MPLLIAGGTLIDGVADKPIEGRSILIDGRRITAIGRRDELRIPQGTRSIDARGKYVIPGLMNANVHLFGPLSLERLARHLDHYEDIIAEAAQVALKNGLTTVFDTCGPRRFLMAARDRIDAGEIPGSRIFCAGNIVGFDGPFSPDFLAKASEMASAALVRRVNSIWVENVGRHLMWMTPEQVAREVRTYTGKGIDFIKYASNEHGWESAGAFLQFSAAVQRAIVDEAHRAGVTAQAHCMSIEGLRLALEAGCDLITHCNYTGPKAIPEATLELFVKRKTGAVIFAWTQRRLEWFFQTSDKAGVAATELAHTMYGSGDVNARNLIRAGAPLLLGNDAAVFAPEVATDPAWGPWAGVDVDFFMGLEQGHFFWFKAMEEKGCAPMEMLRAATRNIAVAYGKGGDLGTLEKGKIADLLVLNKNPLQSAENYRGIHAIVKDGTAVDRESLPVNPILTRPLDPPAAEEASYVPFFTSGRYPTCRACGRSVA